VAWIKFDKDLVDDPRVLRAADALLERYTVSIERTKGEGFSVGTDLTEAEASRLWRNAVTGALVTLWVYADTHILDGDELRLSFDAIDRMVGIEGFCSLLGPEWIEETNYGCTVRLPGYCAKNGLLSKEKRRADNAERQRRYRERHNAERNGVTSNDVTRLDLDQDLDHKKKKSNVGQKPDALRVLSFLNEKTGRNYEPVDANVKPIAARLREGASVDDLRAVVAKKCREWAGDPKMDIYLRPKTLFNATNFANYKGELGAPEPAQKVAMP
jgi:uncharacterized phage protein (TIGR02220 family)